MANKDIVRVDTTFIGYILIGFVLLLFGVFGLQCGGVFGEYTGKNYGNLPIDVDAVEKIYAAVGLILIMLTVLAYRTGKQGSAGIFAFFGLSLICVFIDNYKDGIAEEITSNSYWSLYLALVVFFIILAINAFIARMPRFVPLLLIVVAAMFFAIMFACYNSTIGPGSNVDAYRAASVAYGIIAFIGFVIATYLALAYADPKRIPLV